MNKAKPLLENIKIIKASFTKEFIKSIFGKYFSKYDKFLEALEKPNFLNFDPHNPYSLNKLEENISYLLSVFQTSNFINP